jgi:hypothetical protein
MIMEILARIFAKYATFSIHATKPYGEPDICREDEVPTVDDEKLPYPDIKVPGNYDETRIFWVPPRGWIAYDLCSHMERGMGPLDEEVRGPYRYSGVSEPTTEELEVSGRAGTAIERSIMRGLLCPKCGLPARCHVRDIGAVDYHDEYVLMCPQDGIVAKKDFHGGNPACGSWPTFCPYCGQENGKHTTPPVSL